MNLINPHRFGSSYNYSYGKLYNWYAASHADFAPEGWALPSKANYEDLIDTLGSVTTAGYKIKETGTLRWLNPDGGGQNYSTNQSMFTALPGGKIDYSGGEYKFVSLRSYCFCWSATEYDSVKTYNFYCWYNNGNTSVAGYQMKWQPLSVRLIYTGEGSPSSLTDYDGNVYPVIQIGNQYWIAQNYKCTHMTNGTSIANITDTSEWVNTSTPGWCYYNNNSNNN